MDDPPRSLVRAKMLGESLSAPDDEGDASDKRKNPNADHPGPYLLTSICLWVWLTEISPSKSFHPSLQQPQVAPDGPHRGPHQPTQEGRLPVAELEYGPDGLVDCAALYITDGVRLR